MKKKTKYVPAKRFQAGKVGPNRHHLRIIPWAMTALAVFYLASLIAIIRIYPDIFSVQNSYAEEGTNTPPVGSGNQTTTSGQYSRADSIKSKLQSVVSSLEGKIFSEDYSIRFNLAYDYIDSIVFRLKNKKTLDVSVIRAEKRRDGGWEAKINIDNFSDGDYSLFALVKADFPTTGNWSFETTRVITYFKKQDSSSSDSESTTSGSGDSSSGTGTGDNSSGGDSTSDNNDNSGSGSSGGSGTPNDNSGSSSGTGSENSDSTSSENRGERVSNISPEMKFIEPRNGATLKKTVGIVVSVPYAESVNFNIVKKDSLTEQYLGKAKKNGSDGKRWKLEAQTRNIPNGEYKLFANIKNRFGSYKSKEIMIKVQNEEASPENSSESESGNTNATTTTGSGQDTASDSQSLNEVRENIEKRNEENTGNNGQSQSNDNSNAQNETVAGQLPENVDSDRDGVSNDEELRIGTDPNSADTDKDGYLDGDEIKNGYNPKKSAKDGSDKVVFESPKEKGEIKKGLVEIKLVTSVEDPEKENSSEKSVQLSGTGLPNSFVTLYVYSETPTIVTVLSDENGNWSYTMDKDIEDGQHEAYVAITDNEGHIAAKSEPFFFIKTAEAVVQSTAEGAALQNTAAIQSPVSASRSRQLAVIGIIILISLFTAIACIGLYLIYHNYHKKELAIHKDYLVSK